MQDHPRFKSQVWPLFFTRKVVTLQAKHTKEYTR